MGISGILVGTVLIPSPKLGKQQSHQDGPVNEKIAALLLEVACFDMEQRARP